MKKIKFIPLILNILLSFSWLIATAQVGIGTTNPSTSSMLDIQSTSKGILIPRVTTTQRNTIAGVEGLLVFDSSTKSFWYYNNVWVELTTGTSATNKIQDSDGDTKIEVENIGDEDKIRISTANATGDASVERITVDNTGVTELGTPSLNYTKITSDGSLSYVGTATRWEDLQVPVTGVKIKKVLNEPDWDDFIGSTAILWFEKGESQDVVFTVQMPHKWREGTPIFPHVHWTSGRNSDPAPGSARVKWGLEYYWANVGDVFPTTTPIIYGNTAPTSSSGVIALREHVITPLGSIVGTGNHNLSSMIICRLFRVNDGDYNGDAGLLEIDFHYEVDSDGSNQEYTKQN